VPHSPSQPLQYEEDEEEAARREVDGSPPEVVIIVYNPQPGEGSDEEPADPAPASAAFVPRLQLGNLSAGREAPPSAPRLDGQRNNNAVEGEPLPPPMQPVLQAVDLLPGEEDGDLLPEAAVLLGASVVGASFVA
jgi:hypothetical protein